jgi:hypothetical protein
MRTNLHIVGCPRSGTTLLAEMMSTCFQVDGCSEHEESIFKLQPDFDGLYLSKKPNDILWLERLLEFDARLFVIALIRDPRSVICSIHAGHPGMYFCNYPVWKRAEKGLCRIRNHPHVLVVSYENLVSAPDESQNAIAKAFPFLVHRHAFSEFHLYASSSQKSINALGGIRAVDKSRKTGWMAHLPRLKQQIVRHPAMLDDLVHYGYETDNDWLRVLDGIEARTYPCRYSDRGEWFKHIEQSLRYRKKIAHYLRQRHLPIA